MGNFLPYLLIECATKSKDSRFYSLINIILFINKYSRHH